MATETVRQAMRKLFMVRESCRSSQEPAVGGGLYRQADFGVYARTTERVVIDAEVPRKPREMSRRQRCWLEHGDWLNADFG